MPQQQPHRPGADRPCRLHVFLRRRHQHRAAHDPRGARRIGDGQRDQHVHLARPQRRRQRYGQQDARKRHQPVHHPHQPAVQPAPPAGRQPDQPAGQRGGQRHAEPDAQADLRPPQDARQHIPSIAIRPQPVHLVRRAQPVAIVVLHRIERRQIPRQQGRQRDPPNDRHPDQERPPRQQRRQFHLPRFICGATADRPTGTAGPPAD